MPILTEEQLQREVQRLAAKYGVRLVHLTDSRTAIGAAGMPDCLLIGRGLIWRELKSPYGQLDRDQTTWKWELRAARQDWDIWRPLDLQTGRIAQELEAIATPWAKP